MTGKGEVAREAIENVACDTSFRREVTLDDLRELRDDLDARIEALESELESSPRRSKRH